MTEEQRKVYPSTSQAEHSFGILPFARPEVPPTRWERFWGWVWRALVGRW